MVLNSLWNRINHGQDVKQQDRPDITLTHHQALPDGMQPLVGGQVAEAARSADEVDADALSIEHMDDLWVVSGKWMQQLIADINFADYESRMYFDRQLRKSGLFDRLEEMGIEDGDTVSIYDFEFEYER